MPTAEIVFNPVENERYNCKSYECYIKEFGSPKKKFCSWMMALLATYNGLFGTRCDHCFLLAALTEVHRSKCRTKNYCSQVCRGADDAAQVCCDPDKGPRRIEVRKVKTRAQLSATQKWAIELNKICYNYILPQGLANDQ